MGLKKREVCPDGSHDKNVFDIEPGVAISFFRRGGVLPASVTHCDLWGVREVIPEFQKRIDEYFSSPTKQKANGAGA